eukprot:2297642-Pleurochrysis_carterae.AAC.1
MHPMFDATRCCGPAQRAKSSWITTANGKRKGEALAILQLQQGHGLKGDLDDERLQALRRNTAAGCHRQAVLRGGLELLTELAHGREDRRDVDESVITSGKRVRVDDQG